MNCDPRTTEQDSFAIMDKALDLGVNFFDTANTYGCKLGEGWPAPIIGPRTMAQLTDSLRVLEIQFSQEQLDRLNEIWPGPKGGRPEAFAWQVRK